MGSCVSIHKTTSALKLEMSSKQQHQQKEEKQNSIIGDPTMFSVGVKSQVSPFNSVPSYRSHGSKEETFYDTQHWLESDCEEDFYSVNGDFTPSRCSTPGQNGVGSSGYNRTFSPQVNRALFDARPRLSSASYKSRGSTPLHRRSNSAASPLHQRSNSAASPRIIGINHPPPVGSPDPNQIPPTVPKKKKKMLADLFRESLRERAGESSILAGFEIGSTSTPLGLPPKSPSGSSYDASSSANNSVSNNGKRTPTTGIMDSQKVSQCCFSIPRLVTSRSIRENKKPSSPAVTMNGVKP